MASYWIIPVSEENWRVVKEKLVYGAPEGGRRHPKELIRPGDVVVFYVMKRGSRSLGGRFVGAFKAASEWFYDDKPLWPDEVSEGRVKYPWRVRLQPVKLGEASLEELAPRLSFIGNKSIPHAYLVGTPANMRRPIPEEDAKLIIDSLA
ncbi:MAG: EVE domain-containing protein [Candidatus Alkanophagales archaeon]|nr:MAG: EVE domain-containing protein [Candidatus Alkanophagales archaeon]